VSLGSAKPKDPADEGWASPVVGHRQAARRFSLGWGISMVGFVSILVGLVSGGVGSALLIQHDDVGARPTLTIAGSVLVAGLALWGGGSWLSTGDLGGRLLVGMLLFALSYVLLFVGYIGTPLGAISLVGGGPPGEAIPILIIGLVALGLAKLVLKDRVCGRFFTM